MKQRILRNFQIKQRIFHGNKYQANNIKTEQRIRSSFKRTNDSKKATQNLSEFKAKQKKS